MPNFVTVREESTETGSLVQWLVRIISFPAKNWISYKHKSHMCWFMKKSNHWVVTPEEVLPTDAICHADDEE